MCWFYIDKSGCHQFVEWHMNGMDTHRFLIERRMAPQDGLRGDLSEERMIPQETVHGEMAKSIAARRWVGWILAQEIALEMHMLRRVTAHREMTEGMATRSLVRWIIPQKGP